MCSHNEAAVRWSRTVGDHLSYRNFYMRYECFDSEGNVVIQEDVSKICLMCVRLLGLTIIIMDFI